MMQIATGEMVPIPESAVAKRRTERRCVLMRGQLLNIENGWFRVQSINKHQVKLLGVPAPETVQL